MGSFGGLKTNHNTQVLNTSGKEIPRLYAAGSIISGMYTAPFYNACGWSVLGIVHFGRKAGVNVAALEPWTTEEVTPEADEQAIDVDAAIANANGNYAAGTYTAVGHGLNGDFDVTVTFSEKAITHIAFGEHNETPGIGTIAFDKLPTSILGAQHADVDTVGGATITSNAILNAVKDCIAQAAR